MPAAVITAPVTMSAVEHPLARTAPLGLLARPGGEEDVVVDAQRGKEDEAEQGQRRVDRREAVDVLGEEHAEAERRRVGRHHGREQQQRCGERAQERDEDQQHDRERGGGDDEVVAVGGRAEVVLLGGRAADERVRSRLTHGVRSAGIWSTVPGA